MATATETELVASMDEVIEAVRRARAAENASVNAAVTGTSWDRHKARAAECDLDDYLESLEG